MGQSEYHVLFIGGIFGEFISSKFSGSYMKALTPYFKKIIPGCQVTHFQPLFWQKTDQVQERIENIIVQSKAIYDKKMIIVAHSKGCIDILKFFLNRKELFQSPAIAGVILIAPPFYGSIVAELVIKCLGPLAKFTTLSELKTRGHIAEAIMQQGGAEFQKTFSEKLIIVKTVEARTQKVPHPIKQFHWYMRRKQIASDGLVPVTSQHPPIPPKKVINSENHHGFLTCLPPISKISNFSRFRFFKNLIGFFELHKRKVFQPNLPFAGVDLKVGTYNVGLLPIPLLGVPFSKVRSKELPGYLKSQQLDILCLQEVFGRKPKELIQAALPDFYLLQGPNQPHNGLVTLIRRELVDEFVPIQNSYCRFEAQRLSEKFVGFEKAYLVTELKLKGIAQPIQILNVHLTAFNSARKIRIRQLKQLTSQHLTGSELSLLCGDFNQEFDLDFTRKKSYRAISYINKIKPLWLRESSQRIDYVFPFSNSGRFKFSVLLEELLLRQPTVEIEEAGHRRVELSDHHMVSLKLRVDDHQRGFSHAP